MNFLTTPKIKYSKQVADRILGKTKRWIIQGAVLVPFTAVIPAQAITYVMKKLYPSLAALKIVVICTKRGNKSHWIFDEDEFAGLGRWCINNPGYLAMMYKKWRIDNKKYYEVIKSLAVNGIKDPLKDFVRFYEPYLRQWSAPLIQEYYSLASDQFIRQLITKYGSSAKLQKSISTLTISSKLSFLRLAELAMLDLAIKFSSQEIPGDLRKFRQNFPGLAVKLAKIQKEFFWIHFDYRDTHPHSLTYFYHQICRLVKGKKQDELNKRYNELKTYEKSVKRKQKAEILKSPLTREEARVLKSMGFITYWQDQRKRANLQGNYWCNKFLKLAAKQYGYSVIQLQHMLPAEFISLLKDKKSAVVHSELQKRIKGSLYVVFCNRQESITVKPIYKKIWKTIEQANHPSKASELPGIVASPGRYIGRVRKIIAPKTQGRRMKVGEVLVTYMTRPDFIPLMHKAGAIVADEGGLTSHAAIVSREFKIPCVVGTRFAMRVLKDGDKVEVDATRGTVRKM